MDDEAGCEVALESDRVRQEASRRFVETQPAADKARGTKASFESDGGFASRTTITWS